MSRRSLRCRSARAGRAGAIEDPTGAVPNAVVGLDASLRLPTGVGGRNGGDAACGAHYDDAIGDFTMGAPCDMAFACESAC